MGVLRSTQSFEAEVEEFKREMMILQREKGLTLFNNKWSRSHDEKDDDAKLRDPARPEERMVCVTSGISFLGFALANRLLSRGYTVRLLLHSPEDLEKVREMGHMMFGSSSSSSSSSQSSSSEDVDGDDSDGVADDDGRMMSSNGASNSGGNKNRQEEGWGWGAWVVGDMMDVDSLCDAFVGCVSVFHTSSFSDPSGVSGYSKHMAETEARTAERVIEACVRTQSVRKCVLTSSLLACVWRHDSPRGNTTNTNNRAFPTIVDENCWSDESLCRDRKLWFALGKTMAEKAAWRAARGRDLKLVTLCPGLVTGPGFRRRNSTASIAYLKGARDMLRDGVLATVDVGKLAEAHLSVYEAMDRTACGRYICFDHVVRRVEDVAELERQLGIPARTLPAGVGPASGSDQHPTNGGWFELSKRKLTRLTSTSSRRCSYDTYSALY